MSIWSTAGGDYGMTSMEADRAVCYHPDPEINKEVIADALEAERFDLAAGYPPRRWRCLCGAEHSRGHFGTIGVHRCLACGYVGAGGVLLDEEGQP
jgi:hypothetical protein